LYGAPRVGKPRIYRGRTESTKTYCGARRHDDPSLHRGSPGRCVGKTLVARLLTEFCVLNSREVVAFYLADEGPQLADYLPEFTTLADISDVFGQVSFFEKLITNNKGAQIADLGLSLLD
jgi:hypothetical protein